jgi:hypothetical protein
LTEDGACVINKNAQNVGHEHVASFLGFIPKVR